MDCIQIMASNHFKIIAVTIRNRALHLVTSHTRYVSQNRVLPISPAPLRVPHAQRRPSPLPSPRPAGAALPSPWRRSLPPARLPRDSCLPASCGYSLECLPSAHLRRQGATGRGGSPDARHCLICFWHAALRARSNRSPGGR